MSVVQLTDHMGSVDVSNTQIDRYTHTHTEHLACSVHQSWQIRNARHSCSTKAVYLWVPDTRTVNQFEAIELRGIKSFGGCFSRSEKGPLSTSRNVVVEMEVGMLMLMENIPQTQYLRSLPSEWLTWAFRCRLPKWRQAACRASGARGIAQQPHSHADSLVLHKWPPTRTCSAGGSRKELFPAFLKALQTRDSQNLSSILYFCFHIRVSAEA